MYFIHVHNIGQIIGSMADLKSFFFNYSQIVTVEKYPCWCHYGFLRLCEPGKNVYSAQFVTVYKNPCCRLTNGIFNLKCNTAKIHKGLGYKLRRGRCLGQATMS